MSILQTTCIIFLGLGIIGNSICITLMQKQITIHSKRLTDAYVQIRELSRELAKIKNKEQE